MFQFYIILVPYFARMEECDAFCTRLAIMVKGKFVCLGSPQHLKNKFGDVYILKVKVKTDTHKHTLNDFKDFITMTFPGKLDWAVLFKMYYIIFVVLTMHMFYVFSNCSLWITNIIPFGIVVSITSHVSLC